MLVPPVSSSAVLVMTGSNSVMYLSATVLMLDELIAVK